MTTTKSWTRSLRHHHYRRLVVLLLLLLPIQSLTTGRHQPVKEAPRRQKPSVPVLPQRRRIHLNDENTWHPFSMIFAPISSYFIVVVTTQVVVSHSSFLHAGGGTDDVIPGMCPPVSSDNLGWTVLPGCGVALFHTVVMLYFFLKKMLDNKMMGSL